MHNNKITNKKMKQMTENPSVRGVFFLVKNVISHCNTVDCGGKVVAALIL
jgi:hypothetical protein